MFITFLLIYMFLGAVVGFLSGLLGIGGGLVIVPVLVYLLPLLDINANLVMPIALATSLSSIVVTSTSAVWAHHKNKNIPWLLTRKILLSVAVGALVGSYIADSLSAKVLTNIFAVAVILLAIYMIFSIKVINERPLPNNFILRSIGFCTGIIASLMGISGGAILIPTLTYFGLSLRNTIGVATSCGLMVALFGSLGYIMTGWEQEHLPEYSLGYVYLPVLIGIISTSSLLAPYGVSLAAKLPVQTLKKCFAAFLIVVAMNMMLS
jgi:uncharacterized membrane protein YfcA